MSAGQRRIRRTQLLAGIIVGVIVGTAHALVTHVTSRVDPAVAIARPYSWQSTGADGSPR